MLTPETFASGCGDLVEPPLEIPPSSVVVGAPFRESFRYPSALLGSSEPASTSFLRFLSEPLGLLGLLGLLGFALWL